ncbi:MAG: glycoside hydrolase family 3 protein [Ruminococcus sp.]|nr:glycoside hydrolase family 3 protein [Ruminococcus sp.]
MKKFIIISTILILLAGGAFGYSLYHYLGIMQAEKALADAEAATAETQQEQEEAATEAENLSQTASAGGIFSAYEQNAKDYVQNLSTEQMVGQLLLGVCSDTDDAKTDITRYSLGGFLFTDSNFYDMGEGEVKDFVSSVKEAAKIAPICAVREEGGYNTTFPQMGWSSPRNYYESGGMDAVKTAENEKAETLASMGFNLNLAPVVDMPEDYNQIMYSRSLSSDPNTVSAYADYVTKTSQGKGVSVALKHFPGYGTIPDTTDSIVVDTRDAKTIMDNDSKPFKTGINAGAHFVMVSNVVVQNMDSGHTAALSSTIHSVLREEMGFTGVIITDTLDETDYSDYSDGHKTAVQAILAGNDMMIVKDYETAYTDILAAVNDGTISKDILTSKCEKVIAYKYANGLMS